MRTFLFVLVLAGCGGRIAHGEPTESTIQHDASSSPMDASLPTPDPDAAASDANTIQPDAGCTTTCSVDTVCGLSNPNGISCGGDKNCMGNAMALAQTYCTLAGFARVVSYTELTAWSGLGCLHFDDGARPPTSCSDVRSPKSIVGSVGCVAITALKCE